MNYVDPFGLWYIDINITLGPLSFGTQLSPNKGAYIYSGLIPSILPVSVSVNISPNDPSEGLFVGIQTPGGQVGTDKKGNKFVEHGLSTNLNPKPTIFVNVVSKYPYSDPSDPKNPHPRHPICH